MEFFMRVLPYLEKEKIRRVGYKPSQVGYTLVAKFKKKCRTFQFDFNFNFLPQNFSFVSQSISKIGHGEKVSLKKDPLRFWDPIRRIK
jgi:hypothetical protein